MRAALGVLVAFIVIARQAAAQPATPDATALDVALAAAASVDSAIADVRGTRRLPTLLAPPPADFVVGVLRSPGTPVVSGAAILPVSPILPSAYVPSRPATDRPSRAPAPRAKQSWWPPLASAIVPGSGQGLLRQDRAIAYLAIESYGWLRYASDIREARRQRNGYRTLAARVSRAYLSDETPVGDFEYYERMEHYVESGVFDTSPEEGVQPEVNPESFNGFIWLRARTTFWDDPATPPPPTSQPYFAALEYYADRAIRPEYRWSWRNAQLEQDLFRRTIGRSNDAFRRSIQDLGVIIANHALSTVDAYVTVRIRHAREADSGVGLEATIPWSPRLSLFRADEDGR